jgi:hypothetical protein
MPLSTAMRFKIEETLAIKSKMGVAATPMGVVHQPLIAELPKVHHPRQDRRHRSTASRQYRVWVRIYRYPDFARIHVTATTDGGPWHAPTAGCVYWKPTVSPMPTLAAIRRPSLPATPATCSPACRCRQANT